MKPSSSLRPAIFTVAAFIAAPLATVLAFSLIGAVREGFANLNVSELAVWTFIFYVYATWATLVVGLPSFLLLRKFGMIRWWSATGAGFVIGIVLFVAFGPRSFSVEETNSQAGLWGTIGAFSAFIFWLIWKQGHGQVSTRA